MHPDSPVRQLDDIIHRYGVSSVVLVPFEGGGACVEIHAKGGVHVNEGAASLPEAIGKAFLKLIEKTGGPSFDELLEGSSLGTPEAKALRASVSKETVDAILKKAKHTYDKPAVHWRRYPKRIGDVHFDKTSACGMIRAGGTHARFADDLDGVSCGRCKNTSWYRSELWKTKQQRS